MMVANTAVEAPPLHELHTAEHTIRRAGRKPLSEGNSAALREAQQRLQAAHTAAHACRMAEARALAEQALQRAEQILDDPQINAEAHTGAASTEDPWAYRQLRVLSLPARTHRMPRRSTSSA